ncbi:hypothetical protein QBC47DRAFT_410490 [Echria macrotheca]|uniref:Uncharacterized protein n=1 Tax=Echria macrotheca TaxID=438768 RepID=A0AAJ0BPP4_9PEZI|nr:hypothetical protein QBC47DRAFT_410490 [Echria macrotheca]
MVVSVGQNTASGATIPPLNITNPAPGLDTKGFLFNHGLGETQLLNQLERPGGPAGGPQAALQFPLSHFKGAWSGNGFNMLWAPRPGNESDNTLIAQLTTEQWTFSPTLGGVRNRGLEKQDDITVTGLAYLQTVQNVTNTDKGDGSRLSSTFGSGLHFEPGLFLYVPKARHDGVDSIVRMGTIPHGTTINAQGPVPVKTGTDFGGVAGKPDFQNKFIVNALPFPIGADPANPKNRIIFDEELTLERKNPFREPEDLTKFNNADPKVRLITRDIITNPNIVLANAVSGLNVLENITFEVFTDLSPTTTGAITGGGTTNISFLHGRLAPQPTPNDDPKPKTPAVDTKPKTPAVDTKPKTPAVVDTRLITSGSANARAARMSSRFWIERVEYELTVPQTMSEGESLLIMPALKHTPHEPPTPKFMITAPKGGLAFESKIKAVGTQIQYSQVVDLEFASLVWPHASVATLVPTDAQPWTPEIQTKKAPATAPAPVPVPQKPVGGGK